MRLLVIPNIINKDECHKLILKTCNIFSDNEYETILVYKPYYACKIKLIKKILFKSLKFYYYYVIVDAINGITTHIHQKYFPELKEEDIEDKFIVKPKVSNKHAIKLSSLEENHIKIRYKTMTELLPDMNLFYKPIIIVNIKSKKDKQLIIDCSNGRLITT
jgi:hypothetical protein